MELILWRHAEAEDGELDLKRALTRRGLKQAAAMADWLRNQAPSGAHLLASRALRSQQTAGALTSRFKVVKELDPGRGVEDLLAAVDWPEGGGESGCVIVVGHQPTLGRTAALLLGGAEADWSIKKGAVWWFSNRVRADETQTVLRASMAPEFLT
jgi:phosphohistidine phosphatase